MPVAKLTKRVVDDIEPQAARVIYYDSERKAFASELVPTAPKAGVSNTGPVPEAGVSPNGG